MQNAHPAQDLHTMIDAVPQGFVKLQKTGFKWDLFWNGKLHEGVEFEPFVLFVRANMEEADKLCGAHIDNGAISPVIQVTRFDPLRSTRTSPVTHYESTLQIPITSIDSTIGPIEVRDAHSLAEVCWQYIALAVCMSQCTIG